MMNLNIPFLSSDGVMSIIFKVHELTNDTNTKIFLSEEEKTVFSLFKGVLLTKLDTPYQQPSFFYFAQLDVMQESPKDALLNSVFNEFLPLYYNDYAHLYNVAIQQKESKEDEITVPLWDKAFNADEKPSKGGKEVS